jgi:hypothetical protein
MPHAHHGDELAPAWVEKRRVAIAVNGNDIGSVLVAWSSAKDERSHSSLARAL